MPKTLKIKEKKNSTRVDEIDPEAREIGGRITAALAAKKMTARELAEASSLTLAAVKKIKSGESCGGWAKLARISRTLGTTPNSLLAFNETSSLPAILMTIFQQLGLPASDAEALTGIAFRVVSTPPIESATMTSEVAARAQAIFAVRQLFER